MISGTETLKNRVSGEVDTRYAQKNSTTRRDIVEILERILIMNYDI